MMNYIFHSKVDGRRSMKDELYLYSKLRDSIWEYCKQNNISSNIREDLLMIVRKQLDI